MRSPAHFYVTGYEPAAGLITLAHSIDQFTDPATAIPTLIGLFLLGIVLGEAYILTGSVYFSIGLHSGFVLGAKLWPKIILERRRNSMVDSRRRRNPANRRCRRLADRARIARDTPPDRRRATNRA